MTHATYDRDQVEAILRVALQRADAVEGLTRDELAEVAAEVGIPVTDLDDAIEMIEREREVQERAEQIVAGRKGSFYRSLSNFAIVGTFLGAVDYMSGPGWWVQYVAAVWAMGLAFQGRSAFLAKPEDVDRIARKRLQREWRKRDWKKRERELPKAVEAGAAALIEAAARKIAERIESVNAGPSARVRVQPAPHAASRRSERGQQVQEHEEEVHVRPKERGR